MEEKEKWEDYTKEEKTDLLIHWFKYVEKYIDKYDYTPEDLERFIRLAESMPDDVFNYIVNLWFTKESWSLSKLIENMYFGEIIINATISNIINRDNLDPLTRDELDEIRDDMLGNLIYYGYVINETFESEDNTIEEQSGPRKKN